MARAKPMKKKITSAKTVQVKIGLTPAAGRQAVLKKTLREQGGDYRGITYNPKTGKGKCT